MRNLLTLMNDPDVQDYLGMLYHNRRQPKDLYQSLPSDDRYSTPVYKPSLNPNLVDASYIGVGGRNQFNPNVKGIVSKRPGMTNQEVDSYNFAGYSVVPRNVTRQFYNPNQRRASLYPDGRQPLRSNPAYDPTKVSGTFVRGVGMQDDVPHGNLFDSTTGYPDEGPLKGYLTYQHTGNHPDVVGISLLKDPKTIKPEESEFEEEGPARGLSQAALKKAAEMISASQEGAPTARAFTTRMGTREYQPYMVSPKVGSLASLYLRKREEEV
jgi:hypothetical protein|tara:strand:- start:1299 stop:2102 length:804 start_codon:yes stop_codon:yes gene_type:complete